MREYYTILTPSVLYNHGQSIILFWLCVSFCRNGGYEKNALYVTADHDHYLTLLSHFPEVVANMIIDGVTHNMTPESNSNVNAWGAAIAAGRHDDDSKSQTEHLKDFSTWTEQEIQVRQSNLTLD